MMLLPKMVPSITQAKKIVQTITKTAASPIAVEKQEGFDSAQNNFSCESPEQTCQKCEGCMAPIIEDVTGLMLDPSGKKGKWIIQWKIPCVTPKGGFIIQEIEYYYYTKAFQSLTQRYIESQYILKYFELWEIPAGNSEPKVHLTADIYKNILSNDDDKIRFSKMYKQDMYISEVSKAIKNLPIIEVQWTVKGNAAFCPADAIPEGFKAPGEQGHEKSSGALISALEHKFLQVREQPKSLKQEIAWKTVISEQNSKINVLKEKTSSWLQTNRVQHNLTAGFLDGKWIIHETVPSVKITDNKPVEVD